MKENDKAKEMEYFSKLYLQWLPVKPSDSIASLKKYGYQIRTIKSGSRSRE